MINANKSQSRCGAKPRKTSSSWWMNEYQYEAIACVCKLPAGHDGRHECTHGCFTDIQSEPQGTA